MTRDWRTHGTDGKPWPDTAFWRSRGCARTYKPAEFLPNPGHLCADCLGPEEAKKARRALAWTGKKEKRCQT